MAVAWRQVEPGRGEWAKHAGRGGARAPQEEEAEGEEEGEAEGQQSQGAGWRGHERHVAVY